MSWTRVQISNLAISHLGTGKTIVSIDESSEEARSCDIFYEVARDDALRDGYWPFATAIEDLGLVQTNPNNEWGYSYRYPSNCLMFRKIQSGIRNDNRQSQVPFRIGRDDTGKLIFTDEATPTCEYTLKITDTSEFDSDFVMAMSYKLAYLIAPRILSGDTDNTQDKIERKYLYSLSKAKKNAANEEVRDESPRSEFIRVRSGSVLGRDNRDRKL